MVKSPKIVVLDFEGTSLFSDREATEIGLVALDFELNEIARYETLLNPYVAPQPQALRVSGLTREELVGAPRASEVWPNFAHFFSQSVLVMHNQTYDRVVLENTFVARGLLRQTPPLVCTLELSRQIVGRATGGRHNLETMCAYFGIENANAHAALSDAVATAELLRRLARIEPSILNELSQKALQAPILNTAMSRSYQSTTRLKGNKPLAVAPGVVSEKSDAELSVIAAEILSNRKVEYVNVTGDLTLPFADFDALLKQAGLFYKETPTTMRSAFLVVGHARAGGSKIAKAQLYKRPILLEADAYRLIALLKLLRNA